MPKEVVVIYEKSEIREVVSRIYTLQDERRPYVGPMVQRILCLAGHDARTMTARVEGVRDLRCAERHLLCSIAVDGVRSWHWSWIAWQHLSVNKRHALVICPLLTGDHNATL